MTLRAVGTWREEPWQYPQGRVAPNADAVKRFTWEATALAADTGDELKLGYFTTNTVPVARMEDLAWVAAREKDAIALLERLVQAACDGVGYLPPVNPPALVYQAVHALVRAWIDEGGYPEDWEPQLQRAVAFGAQQATQQVAWAKRLGAAPEPDPVMKQFGWRVRIRPLEQPMVILA